jgi:hypothetical protein
MASGCNTYRIFIAFFTLYSLRVTESLPEKLEIFGIDVQSNGWLGTINSLFSRPLQNFLSNIFRTLMCGFFMLR